MENKYIKPEIEISLINLADVISTSSLTSSEGNEQRVDSCNEVLVY